MQTEELEILKGCLKGKEKSRKMLYYRYYSKMMSVCIRYSRDKDEAKDMLHEGYIKVFKNLKQFQNNGSFEGWVRRIMVNTAINYYKKEYKYLITQSLDNYYDNENPSFEIPGEINPDALSMLEAQHLLEMIQSLPPAYKVVFNLYAIEGFSHKEIAEKLNINEGTSKSNLSKARKKLQKQLKAYQQNESLNPVIK